MIYHSILKSDWEQVKHGTEYTPSSLEKDGYVHFSLYDQVIGITFFLYGDKDEDVLLLEVDEKKLKPRIVFEDNRRHGRFPHAYGPINLDAVVDVYPLEKANTGKNFGFVLPKELRKETVDLKTSNITDVL
jgi:uncharacterized protein (DUF952 family)